MSPKQRDEGFGGKPLGREPPSLSLLEWEQGFPQV